jgi:hypothetical protein
MNRLSPTAERRHHPRQRTLKRAKIVHNKRCSVLDCKVINQSGTGARLDVLSVKDLPAMFEMQMSPEPGYRPARLVWRKANVAGVEWAE